MLKNFWYAIEFVDDVSSKPKRVQCLGQDLVVFRTRSGQAVVLNDLCVHRGSALSRGWVDGECIVCPYHGWNYDAEGVCRKIPYNPNRHIPAKARTDSYPVQERFGFVWTFLGDLPPAERPPIPTWPEFTDPRYRAVTGEARMSANYERVVENGADIAHGPFVHKGTFGDPARPEIPDHEVEETDWSISATVDLQPALPSGLRSIFSRHKERPPIRVTVGVHMPNLLHLRLALPVGELVIYDTSIPLDQSTTLVKWVALRTFFTNRVGDKVTRRFIRKVFDEDTPIVESIRPDLIPFDLESELHVKVDAVSLAYRRMRERALMLGWGVAPHRIETPTSVATVIPSPARRERPELAKAWVLRETPATAVQSEPTARPNA